MDIKNARSKTNWRAVVACIKWKSIQMYGFVLNMQKLWHEKFQFINYQNKELALKRDTLNSFIRLKILLYTLKEYPLLNILNHEK